MTKNRGRAYTLSIDTPINKSQVVLRALALSQSPSEAQCRLLNMNGGWKLLAPWSDVRGHSHDGFVYYSVTERAIKQLCGEGLVTARRTLWWGWILTSNDELVLTSAGKEQAAACLGTVRTIAA